MAGRILLFLIALPFIELWLLIEVGQVIGVFATLALVIGTTIVGTQLVRMQGFQVMKKIQACQRRGETPTIPMLESGALLLAGAFLIIPGLITDTLGFLLLIPPLRKLAAHRLLRNLIVVPGNAPPPPGNGDPAHINNGDSSHDGGDTIEGHYHRED